MTPEAETQRRSYVLARVAAIAIAFGILATVQAVYFQRGFIPGDSFTYLAAGERLNDGHPLYALSPGDRPVGLHPPFWVVPLLSPPPIAVVMRPFALLPGDLGAYAWWSLCLAAVGASILALIRRRPITTSIAVGLLAIPIAYEIGVGNLNSVVLAMLVGAWYLLARGRDRVAAVPLAAAALLKVTPAIMLWWLLTQRRSTGVRAFLVAAGALAIVSLLGAGLAPHLEFLGIAQRTLVEGSTDLSSAGIARAVGAPSEVAVLLPPILLVLGLFAVWLLRSRPGLSWAIAVVTVIAGSPVVNVNWYALLLATVAPLAWPVRPVAQDADPTDTDLPVGRFVRLGLAAPGPDDA